MTQQDFGPVSSCRVPRKAMHTGPGFRRARSPLAPTGKLMATFSKAAKALSPCSSKVAAAAMVTERFWKAGFSGSILPLEEGRDSTSVSLNEDK